MASDSRSSRSAGEPWRIGLLFSRSGIMELVETEHFRGSALAVEEINLAGGVLGRDIEPVCYDPATSPDLYRRFAERLIVEDGVSTIFGCCLSSERKAILPIVERRNALLWYPSLYEGFEYSPNVIYTGATPNQNSIQLAQYLFAHYGKTIYLVGSDYIYPRESNRVMREFIEREGGTIAAERYLPMEPGEEQLRRVVDDIRRTKPSAVFSTVVGHGSRTFYRLFHAAGLDPATMPIASLTMAEGEIQAIGPELCVGHLTSAPYFSSLDTPASRRFVAAYRSRFGAGSAVTMYAEAAYFQIHLFARALARAGSLDTQRLVDAALGLEIEAPQGAVMIDADNQHAWVRPRIGKATAEGEFAVVWEARQPIKPDPYLVNHAYDDAWTE
ncbi:transporter substrate-binding domain-containing protein [Prosthecodimorpha staleyi]|uniref:Transporter substrate-binding domain-containing protein n=1 Tax=Prosthecodimorpha staleyi TaxID=2840188 RepID=A0A947GE31_9HYPH|nr:transporter substrate-binding domain-containing protein [Prosthecodimorpha staleyi]MBT9291452.1 transporter substrate-binding domain-containing protein [Prosthecodimorpha staleyi]